MNTGTASNIVVVGGGFAGIAAVKKLQKMGLNATITLISKNERFEYYPGLHHLVTGAKVSDVSIPLRDVFTSDIVILHKTYTGLDQTARMVLLSDGSTVPYDYVIIALGSEANYFNIPGIAEYSQSFKSVNEAVALKEQYVSIFPRIVAMLAAGTQAAKNEAVALLHTVIVGAGPSGVELAASLKPFLQNLAVQHHVDPSLVTVTIVEAAPRVLPTLPAEVSVVVEKRLRVLGIDVLCNHALQSYDGKTVVLGESTIMTSTVIWTAGTRISTAYSGDMFAFTDRKRVVVSPTLNLPNDSRVFVAGDGAGTAFSGLAQTAIYDGAYVASVIAATIQGKTIPQYKPTKPSFVIPLGNTWAIMNIGSWLLTGYLPSLLRTAIDQHYFWSIRK